MDDNLSESTVATDPRVRLVVRWTDSELQNGQVDADDFPRPWIITSIGFLVKEDPEYIVLARDDMGHDGDYRGLVAIPRICVVGESELHD